MRTWSQLTLREKAILGWGKIRRFCLVHFRPRYVEASIARRKGDCNRTGACCSLLFTCPIYASNPLPTCRINAHKPRVCKMFPIDERDLKDRDIISPAHPCGYWFPQPAGKTGGVLPNT
jgi:hypothetical protein